VHAVAKCLVMDAGAMHANVTPYKETFHAQQNKTQLSQNMPPCNTNANADSKMFASYHVLVECCNHWFMPRT